LKVGSILKSRLVVIPDKDLSGCGFCHKSVLLDESSPAAIVGNFLQEADCEMLPAANKAGIVRRSS
jgi:hypothetical protein